MANETILVVEDEALVGEEIREDLERAGYIVPEIVSSGDEVVEAIAKHRPALVLMDIRIEGSVDGIEAAYQAKAEFGVPIIYLTAYSDPETLDRAAGTAPAAYLLKPFDERELVANVAMTLASAKARESSTEELLHSVPLVDALDAPALLVGLDAKIAHGNKHALSLLKVYDLARLRGERVDRFIGTEAMNAGGACRLRPADGVLVESTLRVEPLRLPEGKEIGTLVLFEGMSGAERSLLERSTAEARAAFADILPEPGAGGDRIANSGFLLPCPSGSGDLFDLFELGEGKAAFYGLDVMGHGSLPSLIAYSLHEVVRFMARDSGGGVFPPSAVLRRLNERYSASTSFYSIIYGIVDGVTGAFRFARAGHPPLIYIPAEGRAQSLFTAGTAIGAFENIDVEEGRGVLFPGDRLLIASDGLFEGLLAGTGESGVFRGIEVLSRAAEERRGLELDDFVASVRDEVLWRRGSATLIDDASLLVLERKA